MYHQRTQSCIMDTIALFPAVCPQFGISSANIMILFSKYIIMIACYNSNYCTLPQEDKF